MNQKCTLCNYEAIKRSEQQPGYQQPNLYSIYHCQHCQTAFASPLKSDEKIYNLIYSQIDCIAGYERYARYAVEILRHSNPLDYLAKQEEIYWAIKKYLDESGKKDLKILEVGCGFGYLTYALARKGYNVTGLDISKVAVEKAKEKYGDFYICSDVKDYAQEVGAIYDLIIFTEVIEHISEVKSFLNSLNLLLNPAGEMILTTPNRSCYADDVLWETEPPPVHLWWFSEHSIKYLADAMGYLVRFTDFTEYNQGKEFYMSFYHNHLFPPTRSPRLDEKGKPVGYHSYSLLKRIKNVFWELGLWTAVKKILKKVERLLFPVKVRKLAVPSHRQFALCAILKRK